jgi:hypothetical protein
LALIAVLVGGSVACDNFLKGGELTTNPNEAPSATASNLFEGVQSNLWTELGSDMSRTAMLWAQHITGNNVQYEAISSYSNDENVTNGFHQGMYIGGGLIDIRNMEAKAKEAGDTLFWGVAQVMEGWLMGQGADLFGDLVYSHAYAEDNPPLDKQAAVYARVQAVLDSAIDNLAHNGPTDVGPSFYDLAYGGDPELWTALAYTLKARYYMHTIKGASEGIDTVAALTNALAAATNGIQPGGDYTASFSGLTGEQNFWYQFNGPAGRSGYYVGTGALFDTLTNRGTDPRLASYYNASGTNLSSARLDSRASITFASALENQLLLAEANARLGNTGAAQDALSDYYDMLPAYYGQTWTGHPNPSTLTAQELLNLILTEKWITDFQMGTESWTDYRRTCTPNLEPFTANGRVPGRLFYDSGEQQTNTSIPVAGTGANGFFNQLMPPLATSDGTGTACLAYAP